jgi:hypothetical protein
MERRRAASLAAIRGLRSMDREVAIDALRRGKPLAAELECTHPQRRAWIGVYPLDLSHPTTRQFIRNAGIAVFPEAGRAYSVRTFEVERRFFESDVWIGETELLDQRSSVAFSEADLMEQLKSFGASLESLDFPHKSDYPI